MRIIHVVGTRPNFMKVAPVMHEMLKYPSEFEQVLVHTGQHYDDRLSQVFFDELQLPKPDVNLEVGSGSHAWQTAQIMQRFEPVLMDFNPHWIIVPGDVNSTLACALVASKLQFKIAHLEAGLRSFDRTMPEETNRVLTDHLADLLFTTESSANQNLKNEGISNKRIKFVGNVMIDSLVRLLPKANARWKSIATSYDLPLDRPYVLVTLHRPSNVDNFSMLTRILSELERIASRIPVIFPVHPRTRDRIEALGRTYGDVVRLLPPLGYLDFVALESHAQLVITDSGGVQEETTYLGVSCLTLRNNTERPVTVTGGTNRLVSPEIGMALSNLVEELLTTPSRVRSTTRVPELWDGNAAVRVVSVLRRQVNQ